MASAAVMIPVAVAQAFSPGHITGFFEVPHVKEKDPLRRGSKGAGFSVDAGITTTVHVYDVGRGSMDGSKIMINGREARPREAEVSQWVVDQYLKGADRPCFIKVEHDIAIPVGFGLGSSGAAALSLSYALNEALGSRLTRLEAAQLAHRAELACRTGLGTVIAEYGGGFEMRLTAGAPGIGEVETIPLHDGYRAVVLCMAPISTKSFLADRMDEINGLGGRMLLSLSESKDIGDFLDMSFAFAQKMGLTEGACKGPIEALAAEGFRSSVALFGQTVFTVVPTEERAKEAAGALAGFGGTLLVCGIDGRGARVLRGK